MRPCRERPPQAPIASPAPPAFALARARSRRRPGRSGWAAASGLREEEAEASAYVLGSSCPRRCVLRAASRTPAPGRAAWSSAAAWPRGRRGRSRHGVLARRGSPGPYVAASLPDRASVAFCSSASPLRETPGAVARRSLLADVESVVAPWFAPLPTRPTGSLRAAPSRVPRRQAPRAAPSRR